MQGHEKQLKKMNQENQQMADEEEQISQQEKQISQQEEQQNDQKIFKNEKQRQIKYQRSPEVSKQQKQLKEMRSLDKIEVESPFKRTNSRTQIRSIEKAPFNLTKIGVKQKTKSNSVPSFVEQSSMKSTLKSSQKSHKSRKTNKTFYEQTFYITGMKQNYLLLLSDNNQVIEFPVGMFITQNNQESSEQKGNNFQQQGHLIKDIKIGQPIKIKLEFDYFRQQKDEQLFKSLQRNIHDEYSSKCEESEFQFKKNQNKDLVLNQMKKQE